MSLLYKAFQTSLPKPGRRGSNLVEMQLHVFKQKETQSEDAPQVHRSCWIPPHTADAARTPYHSYDPSRRCVEYFRDKGQMNQFTCVVPLVPFDTFARAPFAAAAALGCSD